VTENGYGKRTAISEYPAKNRDTMGVKTITLTENKGALAGALVVREHQELVFISQGGMVQRTSVRGISRYGRASQGVKVMNIRDDDQVSAVALVVESQPDEVELITDPETGEPVGGLAPDGMDLDEPDAEVLPAEADAAEDPEDDDAETAEDDLPEGLIAIEPDEDGQLGLGLDLDDESDDNEDE
jgi:DNA gyrase subunit A